MDENLDAIKACEKEGTERFTFEDSPLPFNLLQFWQWSQSDLLSNASRGVLAEFLVAKALDIKTGVRSEWDSVDLKTDKGIKIEVKSSAYLQSWKQKKHSQISFGIAPTKGWDPLTNRFDQETKRQADIYIFCILKHRDKSTVDPVNLDQWEFYILKTATINDFLGNQKNLNLSSLLKLNPWVCDYNNLKLTVENLEKELL